VNARRTPLVATLFLACGSIGLAAVGLADLPPGHQVNQKDVCLVCHDLENAMTARVKHAPFESGECSACHNPHVSRFDALLLERPQSLCVKCHGGLQDALERAVVHAPAADGRCVECHQPHGGDHAKLLSKPARELCLDCHAEISDWESRSVQHPPFVRGNCADCHDPHGADYPGLASKPGSRICSGCHTVDAAFTQRHGGYPVESAPCRQCHDPHSSDRAGLFRAKLHAPFEDGDCTTCHVDAGAKNPFALVAGQARLCGQCHEQQVEESKTGPFTHVSAGGGRCTDCHNPHSGDSDSLLNTNIQAVCLECHDPGGASSKEPGRFVTHSDLDCSACHAPHAADRPLMLKVDSVELCGECHTHQHGVRHPLGEETRDPRSGDPMTCLSCHGVHDAPYDMYLLGAPDRDLCLGCHKDIGGGG
jgi:predicted CXXCH cytochrome family protein